MASRAVVARPGRAAPAGGVVLLAVSALGLLALCLWLAGLGTPLEGGAKTLPILATFGLLVVGAFGIRQVARRSAILPAAFTLIVTVLAVEALLRANNVPPGLIPTPSLVLRALWTARVVLGQDVLRTFGLEALTGFIVGSLAGLLLSLLVVRFKFLERGLLPYAALFSSIPIVALAPVLVNAIGLEWYSKAVTVAVTVLFPVVVNAVRGLQSANPMHLDLMRSYAATPGQVFAKVRTPTALPFVFNALKIGTTLSLISAIVAEFFGTDGKGLGFRIQIEAGKFNFDIVWAAIVLASVVGIAFFGAISWLERRYTGWHASNR